jgi:hypothetical protein
MGPTPAHPAAAVSLIEINRRIVILHHPANRMQSPTTTLSSALQRPIMKEQQQHLKRSFSHLLLLPISSYPALAPYLYL